jgi:hypothetical protein
MASNIAGGIGQSGKYRFMSFLEKSRLRAARALTANIAEHLHGDLSLELWNKEVLPLGPGARFPSRPESN